MTSGQDGQGVRHFNVPLIVRARSQLNVFVNATVFLRERKAERASNRGLPAYQPNALPLGQTALARYNLTGSVCCCCCCYCCCFVCVCVCVCVYVRACVCVCVGGGGVS